MRERITAPLGLHHTALDTPGLTQGHGFFGRAGARLGPRVGWPAPAGCARPPRDMLAYLAIHAPADGPLAAAARETRVRRGAMGKLGVGLGWVILPAGSGRSGSGSSTRR